MLSSFNQILQGNCVELMKMVPDGLIPLTLTSPPFDDIRDFDGWLAEFDFEAIATELYRITCDGGVVCWHVQNQIDGGESCTAEEQKLFFRKLGFVAHNTIIIETNCAYLSYGAIGSLKPLAARPLDQHPISLRYFGGDGADLPQ